jgi:hypothetical protein
LSPALARCGLWQAVTAAGSATGTHPTGDASFIVLPSATRTLLSQVLSKALRRQSLSSGGNPFRHDAWSPSCRTPQTATNQHTSGVQQRLPGAAKLLDLDIVVALSNEACCLRAYVCQVSTGIDIANPGVESCAKGQHVVNDSMLDRHDTVLGHKWAAVPLPATGTSPIEENKPPRTHSSRSSR